MKSSPRILFHPLKHHLGHRADFTRNPIAVENFQSALLRIGAVKLDLYSGFSAPEFDLESTGLI